MVSKYLRILGPAAILLVASGCGTTAMQNTIDARQWQVTELTFQAERDYPDPFDFRAMQFHALFRGPEGARLEVPGFWDGGRTWRVRFTPTLPGRWHYTTTCGNQADAGLHGLAGALRVTPPEGHPLHAHGGFLQVGPNQRHLTYTDGTPFLYLADTWWTCPSSCIPIDDFRLLVDTRRKQGYTAFQAHGFRPLEPGGANAFESVQGPSDKALDYWRGIDPYYAYADQQGLLGVIGFYGAWSMGQFPYENHERLWHYFLARYGAYPITFLITQEYNVQTSATKGKGYDARFVELGAFIKAHDPYQRAMTAHAWAHGGDNRLAWDEPWYDFIMLQGGHNTDVSPGFYWRVYERPNPKPFLQSELNYEGFARGDFHCDAACIRRSAYTAMQCGGLGFGYGAQGLYAGIRDKNSPGPTSNWGPVLDWKEGLEQEGGAQLAHFQTFYESVDWPNLTPFPEACPDSHGILVQRNGDRLFVLYLAAGSWTEGARLHGVRTHGAVYAAHWFDPRTGATAKLAPIESDSEALALPRPPNNSDWLLVLRHLRGGQPPVAQPLAAGPKSIQWDFANGLQGWTAQSDIRDLHIRDGMLCGTVAGPDPILVSPDRLNVNLSRNPRIELRIRNGTPLTNGRVYFRTTYGNSFVGNSADFAMAANEKGLVTYEIGMGRASNWAGRLLQLRIDPGDFRQSGLPPTGDFAIQSIRIGAPAQQQ